MSAPIQRGGYTLIEVMVAIAIVGIMAALTPITYRVLAAEGRPGQIADSRDDARQVLWEALEEMRLASYDTISDQLTNPLAPWASRIHSIELSQRVRRLGRGVLEVVITARWTIRDQEQTLQLIGIKGHRGW